MYNSDYIPLDQKVIDQAVEELQKNRNRAKAILAEALKNKDTGGNFDIIVFHELHKDFKKFKRIVKALEDLRIFWCEHDGEILVSRHELYDIIYNRSGN